MAHERAIETADFFRVFNAVTWFPDAETVVNGGNGQTVAATSRLADAKEVVVYGFFVSTAGTSIQFKVGDASTTVVGMLYPTTATGMVLFPAPILLRAATNSTTANLSVTTVGASTIYVYYKKLA